MAEINYTEIAEKVKSILEADERIKNIQRVDDTGGTDAVTVVVDEPFNNKAEATPFIGIYLDTWETPADEELIGGASPSLTRIGLELWMYEWHLENIECSKRRDNLLRRVKEALKADRTLSGTVQMTRFQGGEFDSPIKTEGFFKGVSLKLECEIRE